MFFVFYGQEQAFDRPLGTNISVGAPQESVDDGFGLGHRGHLSRPEDQGGPEDVCWC